MNISPARRERLLLVDERNHYLRERQEWGRVAEEAKRRGWPLPVGGGVNTLRKMVSQGFEDQSASWLFNVDTADFGQLVLAGAGTVREVNAFYPLTNPWHTLKSPDNYPSEQPAPSGGKLGASLTDRKVGTGNTPIALLVGVWLVHLTPPATAYIPAASTLQVRVDSTDGTAASSLAANLTAAATPTAAQSFDSVPITAPTDRQFGMEGILLTTIAALFNGDILFTELVAGGALTVNPNLLAVMVETG
jgi:hypothetical protein